MLLICLALTRASGGETFALASLPSHMPRGQWLTRRCARTGATWAGPYAHINGYFASDPWLATCFHSLPILTKVSVAMMVCARCSPLIRMS
jgi:hypothetical protein